MTEFKVGDKVRLTGRMWGAYEGFIEGESFEPDYIYEVDTPGLSGAATAGNAGVIYADGDYAVEIVYTKASTELGEAAKKLGIDPVQEGDFVETAEDGFAEIVKRITGDISEMLIAKNKSYGNAALDPIRVFSSASAEEQLLVRIDDKLSRLKRGHEYPGDDTVRDLIGYLVLLLASREGE